MLRRREPTKASAFSVRRPLQIAFEPPADRSNWRVTGRINWPSRNEGYGVPICEWANDEGTRIWLSAPLKELRSNSSMGQKTAGESWLCAAGRF
jgi:hypothetical protein